MPPPFPVKVLLPLVKRNSTIYPICHRYLLPVSLLLGAPNTTCRHISLPFWPSSLLLRLNFLCLIYQGLFRPCSLLWLLPSHVVLANCDLTATRKLAVPLPRACLLDYPHFHPIPHRIFIKVRFGEVVFQKPLAHRPTRCSYHLHLFHLPTRHSSKVQKIAAQKQNK